MKAMVTEKCQYCNRIFKGSVGSNKKHEYVCQKLYQNKENILEDYKSKISSTNISKKYKIDVSLISGNGGSNGQLLGANTGNVSFQSIFTGNVIESGNTSSGNVYFSNARAIGALVAGDNISIAANGRISANLSAVSVSSVTGNLNVKSS